MSDEKFQGMYQVSDGYVSGSRPKYFSVSSDDIGDDATEEDLANLYEELAYEDFLQNVNCDTSRSNEFVEWAKQILVKRKDSDQ